MSLSASREGGQIRETSDLSTFVLDRFPFFAAFLTAFFSAFAMIFNSFFFLITC
jgi:hypothetical protein